MASALNEIQVSRLDTQLLKGIKSPPPPAADIANFNSMMQRQGASPVQDLVAKAENQLIKADLDINGKLQRFNASSNVYELVSAMHESSLRSVSIQLTGKIGSKSSEGVEQLIKQQ